MNVHHLELFYYVAKHGGVSAAARQIPYGIQQPAISAQILQLEDSLGLTLFQRRPFQLSAEGQMLFEHIEPFFNGLGSLEQRLRGGAETRLRIATPEIVQREYLPELLSRMRKRVPQFHFTLMNGRQAEIEARLLAQEADLGLSLITDKPTVGMNTRELQRMTMVLLVPEKSRIKCMADVLGMDRIGLPLITLGSREALPRVFGDELRTRGVDWLPTLELGGLDLVAKYVAQGFGIGLSMHVPRMKLPAGIREVPLDDFPMIPFCALWMGRLTPLGESFLEESRTLAVELFG
ncbi:MAG: LysR family transcriptional regulator [Verrucomicrobiaceae bacterium]|nr:LysR family transcriptional regulator [Verrucomicrobiaceae bacterium]MDB6118306.1 LysR family transcriptional regulator [Verrucomicrobiaceae bacterium]